MQVFVAVALPSLAYREASDYNADLEGTTFSSLVLVAYFHCIEFASIPFVFLFAKERQKRKTCFSDTVGSIFSSVRGSLGHMV